MEKSNAEYLENFISTNISYEANTCKYTAKLPLKDDHKQLPSNIDIARRRTENVVRRLSNDPFLLRKYGEIINDQEKRGFIERIDNTTTSTKHAHYVTPHSVKKDSATTPIRIVYDCSCRQSNDTPSLNDCLRIEPPILNDISTLLMQFRENRNDVVTDIEKAFLQITLDEKDRDMKRFFWLKDSTDPTSELITYRSKAILFGATCSPFILNATLLKHLREQSSHTSETHLYGVYVDNIIAGFDNTTELLKFYEESRALMTKGGFNLRSWASNCTALNDLATSQNVNDGNNCITVLGLRWNTKDDRVSFGFKPLSMLPDYQITKREILRRSSKIYDPLGILSLVTVRSKILLQDLWTQKLGWDEQIPDEIRPQLHSID
ncbi:uncharacterized protein [Mytilus edulis]|uniref:uncharacterized protein n=1 Tax=Mytilus edulis TaxID=6550 RepID=UPI0039EE847A